MHSNHAHDNKRPPFDELILTLADYICDTPIDSELAYETAKYCLVDSMGCAMLALTFPACTQLLGPWVSGCETKDGARVPGTEFELDPVKAAFDIGTMVRWLDYNDTWLAKEWGHPSDNLGGILSVMDFVSKRPFAFKDKSFTVQDVLTAMIKTYEIQGVLALENSFNAVGLDHVILVKIATCGVVTQLLGGDKNDVINALSQALVDGQSLRTYRHAPNTGSRKSWAAGDATSRGVRLAMLTLQGEKGYPSCISAKRWGFSDVLFGGKPIALSKPLGSYVMENILFKIAYPAEFHAQTAVECALKLHEKLKDKLNQISSIHILTHNAAMRIINKTGKLYNPADRDHCLQYMVAVALLKGELTAAHYEDETANDPAIDALRDKMMVEEKTQYSEDYLNPEKRSIANQLTISLTDGSKFTQECEYPLGHRFRREEGIPLMWQKFEKNCQALFSPSRAIQIREILEQKTWLTWPVPKFMALWQA